MALDRDRKGWEEAGVGEVRGLRRMAAGEGGLSRQSALLTTDKNGYLWAVAQSSCLPQEQDKMQVGQHNVSEGK